MTLNADNPLTRAGWYAGQLEHEVSKGMWHVLAASVDVILNRGASTPGDGCPMEPDGRGSGSGTAPELWSQVMRLANEYHYDR